MFWTLVIALVVLGLISFVFSSLQASKEKTYSPPPVPPNPLYTFADQLHNAGLTFRPIDRIMRKPLSDRFLLPSVNRLDNGDCEIVYPESVGPNTFGVEISRDTILVATPILSQALRRNIRTVEQKDQYTYVVRESSTEVEYGFESLCGKAKLTQSVELQGMKTTVSAKITEEEDGDVVINVEGLSVGKSHIESQMDIFIAEFGRYFSGVVQDGHKVFRLVSVSEKEYNKAKNWEALCKRNKLVQVRDKATVIPDYTDSGEGEDREISIDIKDIQLEDSTINEATPDLVTFFGVGISGFNRSSESIELQLVEEDEFKKIQKTRSLARSIKLVGEKGELPTFRDENGKDIVFNLPDSCIVTDEYLNSDRILSAFSSTFERPIAVIKRFKTNDTNIIRYRAVYAPPHKRVVEGEDILEDFDIWMEKVCKPMKERKLLEGEEELLPLGQVVNRKYQKSSFIFEEIGQRPHFAFVGQTRSGKTKSAFSFLAAFSCAYPETKFYCVDGKNSSDWQFFTTKLSDYPLATVDDTTGDPLIQFANIIDEVWNHYVSRKKLFSEKAAEYNAGISTIYDYRKMTKDHLPHVFLVMDEFKEFVSYLDVDTNVTITDTLANRLMRLMTQAGSFGIHVCFLTQQYQVRHINAEFRGQVTSAFFHSLESADVNYVRGQLSVDMPDALPAGHYVLKSLGVFDENSGVTSGVHCTLPYVGSGPRMTALFDRLFPNKRVHKRWDYNLSYAKTGTSNLGKLAPEEILTKIGVDIFRKFDWEYECLWPGVDPTSVDIAGVVEKDGRKIGISFVRLDTFLSQSDSIISSLEEDASERGFEDIFMFLHSEGKTAGKIDPEVFIDRSILPITRVDWLAAVSRHKKDGIAAKWLKKLDRHLQRNVTLDEIRAGRELKDLGKEDDENDEPVISKPQRPVKVSLEPVKETSALKEVKRGRPSVERKREGDKLECLSCKNMLHKSKFLGPSGKGAPKTTCETCRGTHEEVV